MPGLKRAGAISLLFILFYTQLGYYGLFLVRQWQLKEEAEAAWLAGLPDEQLSRLRLSDIDTGGKWEEKGRECWYQGHLYDVVRQRTIDGTIYLLCMDDEREERLIRESDAITRANGGHDHSDKKNAHSLRLAIGDMLPAGETQNIQVPHRPDPADRPLAVHAPSAGYTETTIPPPKG